MKLTRRQLMALVPGAALIGCDVGHVFFGPCFEHNPCTGYAQLVTF